MTMTSVNGSSVAEAGQNELRSRSRGRRWGILALENANLVALVVLMGLFTAISPAFLNLENLGDVIVQVAPMAVIAVPMTFVIISGQLDLSVGSVTAFGAVVGAQAMVNGIPWPIACILGLLAGALVGAFNGLAVSVAGFSTIIVTLGTLTAVRGLTLIVGPKPLFGFPEAFTDLTLTKFLGVPLPAVIAVMVFIVGWLVLNWTAFGRHVFAIGVNQKAAFLSGINIRRTGFFVFLATGLTAGLAGIMYASRLASAPAEALAIGLEVDVLTAVLLGGVAFSGGRGSLVRVALGVLFLGVLSNGLILLNVSTAWSLTIRGLVLVAAAGAVYLEGRVLSKPS